MTNKTTTVCLALLGLFGLPVGVWATFAPRSFYDDFPGGGRTWVAVDGPYNEHLVRDFGSLNLGLVVVVAIALFTRSRTTALAAGAGWLVYSVPHLVYHARHLDVFDTGDKVFNVAALGGAVVLALAVVATAGSPRAGRE